MQPYETPIGLYLGPVRFVEKQDDCWPSKEERQRQASVAIHEQFEQINLQLHDIRCELAKLHDRLDAHGITLKRMSTRDNLDPNPPV